MASDESDPERTIDREALRSVLDGYPLRLAVLFGSQVDGSPEPPSDVDVGVLFEADCPDSRRREVYLDLHATVAETLGTDRVDVTVLDDLPPAVGRQALQSCEVLLGDSTLIASLRDRYASAPPSRETLVERLDEGLTTLDEALGEDQAPGSGE